MTSQTIERPAQRPAAGLKTRFPGRFVSVTSFKRDGTGVATPLWAVDDGRRLYALTDLRSAKVRRIRRNPAISVPCGFTKAGLPVGLQIVGPLAGDHRVLRAAHAFEATRMLRLPAVS